MRRALMLIFICLICFPSSDVLATSDDSLELVRIGIADDPSKMPHYRSLINHLNQSKEYQFELEFYLTADSLHEDFVNRQIRLAFFGPVYYAKVHHETGAIPLVKDIPNSSVFIVREDSKLDKIQDLPGHTLALGYPDSTTSNLIPRLLLTKERMADLLTDNRGEFESKPGMIYYEFTGSHGGVIEQVLNGKFDAGAVLMVIFERNKHRGLRAIEVSEPFPGVPLVCNNDEEPLFMDHVRSLFMTYRSPAGVPYHHMVNGASLAIDADYNKIRFLCKVVLGKDYR